METQIQRGKLYYAFLLSVNYTHWNMEHIVKTLELRSGLTKCISLGGAQLTLT